MKLIWGILIFILSFLHIAPLEGGRVVPQNSRFMKRVGPFFNEKRRVYNHPYMQDRDHIRGHPAEVREQQRWPPRQQSRPATQISERKLLMPIISEGYASTKFQGGLHGQTEEEKKKTAQGTDLKTDIPPPENQGETSSTPTDENQNKEKIKTEVSASSEAPQQVAA